MMNMMGTKNTPTYPDKKHRGGVNLKKGTKEELKIYFILLRLKD